MTLPQILEKAISAHNAGKHQEASQLYSTILQANSKHPSANFNMGLLYAGLNKVEAALPFFRTAFEVRPTNINTFTTMSLHLLT